jgi:erythromycin esterase
MLAALLAALPWLGCRKENSRPVGPPRPSPGEPAPQAAVDWVRQHAAPLSTDDPAGDPSDLSPFAEAVGTARVVALGEATHGTHEFFRMKHRLLADLVRRQGFRVFAMEADAGGSCDIDDYLHTGKGNPADLIRDLRYWTWNTQEFLDMVRWMRAYNESVPPSQAVSFRGIDMQNPFAMSSKVVTFLNQVDPALARKADATYRCLGPLEDHDAMEDGYLKLDPVEQMKCAAGVTAIYKQIVAGEPRYSRSVPPRDAACALWNAQLMIQAELLLKFPSTRDHHYAENIVSLLKAPGPPEKVVVWAHNRHIANAFGSMGRGIRRKLGDDYRIVALTFHGGSFRARPRQPGGGAGAPVPVAADSPGADSYEEAFHRAGLPRFLLDVRPLRSGAPGPAWLAGPHPLRMIGGAFDPMYASTQVRLPEEYDLIIFFDQGTPSEALPKGNTLPR